MHLLTTVEATALESSIYDAKECVSAKKNFFDRALIVYNFPVDGHIYRDISINVSHMKPKLSHRNVVIYKLKIRVT